MPEFNPVPFNEEIVVAEHDPAWEERFQTQRKALEAEVGEVVAGLEHFGSTSVPSLIAKPVIGVLMGVETWPPEAYLVERLQEEGWLYFGQMGRRQRHYLRRRDGQHFNIHIVQFEGEVWRDNLLFRDYLRSHADEVEAYAKIKRQAFELGAGELDGYSSHKYAMMRVIQKRAHEWETCNRDDSKIPAYCAEQERLEASRQAERRQQLEALQMEQVTALDAVTPFSNSEKNEKLSPCVECGKTIAPNDTYHFTLQGRVHGAGKGSDSGTCSFAKQDMQSSPARPLALGSSPASASVQRGSSAGSPLFCGECQQPIMSTEAYHYTRDGVVHGSGPYGARGTCTAMEDEVDIEAMCQHTHSTRQRRPNLSSAWETLLAGSDPDQRSS